MIHVSIVVLYGKNKNNLWTVLKHKTELNTNFTYNTNKTRTCALTCI